MNTIVSGMLLGAIAPILAYVLSVNTSIQQVYFSDKPIALYVIAALINLIIVRFTNKSGKESLAKGVVAITFIGMLALIYITQLKA